MRANLKALESQKVRCKRKLEELVQQGEVQEEDIKVLSRKVEEEVKDLNGLN